MQKGLWMIYFHSPLKTQKPWTTYLGVVHGLLFMSRLESHARATGHPINAGVSPRPLAIASKSDSVSHKIYSSVASIPTV
jgi:hypothetical protein